MRRRPVVCRFPSFRGTLGQWYLRPESTTDDPPRPEWPEPSETDLDSLDKLARALAEGRAALMGVRRRSDGAPAIAACAFGTGRSVTPLALMVGEDPFALLHPPAYCVATESGPPVVASGVCPKCGSRQIGTLHSVPGIDLGRVEEGRFVTADRMEIDWNGAVAAASPFGTALACAACATRWVHPALAQDGDDDESPAAILFSVALDECLEIMASLKDAIDDHLGASPDKVTWGHKADAGRIRRHLRHAAFVAGVGPEPED